jgi:predicted PurR-regulated permease PerM
VITALDLGPGGAVDAEAAVVTAEAPAPADDPAPAEGPSRSAGVPVWLDRLGQWSWRALVLATLAGLVIALVVRIPSVVVPGVIAVVAAATLLPLVSRLSARGWGRATAAAVSTGGAALAIGLVCVVALLMTIGPLREVLDAAVAGASRLDLAWLRDLVREASTSLEVDVAAAFAGMLGLGLGLLLALLMTFFFLRDGAGWWSGVMARLPAGRRVPVAEAGGRAVDVLAGYMVGTAVISGFGAVTTGLILVVLGLPLAVPVTVIGFFFGFIPYVGSFLSTALALLVTVALGTTTDVVVMLVFTVVFNIAQGNFVTPLVYGRSLSLHPAVVLMAIPIGGEVAGILGMFLVVPVAAMVAATWRLLLRAIDGPAAAGSGAAGSGAAGPGDAGPGDAGPGAAGEPEPVPDGGRQVSPRTLAR